MRGSTASPSFARDMLGVADNMRRALEAVTPELRASAESRRQGAHRRRRTDRARAVEGAGKERRAAIHAAGREIRSQPASGHVRSARRHGAGRQRRAGGAARLHDRRARAAAGSGRGVEGRPEGRAGRRSSNDNAKTPVQIPRSGNRNPRLLRAGLSSAASGTCRGNFATKQNAAMRQVHFTSMLSRTVRSRVSSSPQTSARAMPIICMKAAAAEAQPLHHHDVGAGLSVLGLRQSLKPGLAADAQRFRHPGYAPP